jgi:hypothetical protein
MWQCSQAAAVSPETMLLIHFMPPWFNLGEPAMEETLHDMPLFRNVMRLDGWDEHLPDDSAILRFRHVLDKHKLCTADAAGCRRPTQRQMTAAQERHGRPKNERSRGKWMNGN